MFWIAAVLAGSGDMPLVLMNQMDPGTSLLVLKTHIFLCLMSVQQLQCEAVCLVGGDCVHPGCVQI